MTYEYVNSRSIMERVKEVRGLEYSKLAKEIFDISQSNLSNRIRQDRLNLYVLLNWAIKCRVNAHWLLTGEGEMHVEKLLQSDQARLSDHEARLSRIEDRLQLK